jgi:hypothetical protein
MLWTPSKGALLYEHTHGNSGTSGPGVLVSTASGSSSTKGTAVELIASTAFDAYLVHVIVSEYGASATTSRLCVDLLIGAATEEVLIADMLCGFTGSLTADQASSVSYLFPLYIPSGSRLAARCAGDRTGINCRVSVQLYGGAGYPPFPVGQRVRTYGIGTVPNGTDLTPGASGAEGSWTQITASTTEDLIAIIPSAQPPTGDTTLTTSLFRGDIGVGAATEEVIAGGGREQSFLWRLTSVEIAHGLINPMPLFADIPSGSRLSARLSRTSAADTTATWNMALHCVSA